MDHLSPDLPSFELRPQLLRLAYRMLGSVADAEDVVQDAYVRWLGIDRGSVREPAALLRTIVTRLCLNELKSARRKRESYVGPWLPEGHHRGNGPARTACTRLQNLAFGSG